MRRLRVLLILAAMMMPSVALASSAQPQPPTEFVPVDEVPPGEQIPAINLVAAAYGFVWVVVLGYVWSIARRLKTVESEVLALESRRK